MNVYNLLIVEDEKNTLDYVIKYLTEELSLYFHLYSADNGKSAHSMDEESGVNAINEAVFKITEIIKSKLNETVSFNCGVVNGTIDVFDTGTITNIKGIQFGTVDKTGGEASFQYVKNAMTLLCQVKLTVL